jgi:hypothetical protein
MAPSQAQEKRGREYGIRATAALLALGVMVALTAEPALASGREGDESCEKRGAEKSESKFYGTVQKIPPERVGTWVVNGREILVTKETRIREEYGTVAEGAYVEVEGNNTGKTFTACKVEVKRAKK